MNPTILSITLVVLLAGCVMPPPTPADKSTSTPQALTLIAMDGSDEVLVRVKNWTPREMRVSHSDFRIVDKTGLATTPDLTRTYWHKDDFPSYETIHPREALEGWLVFDLPSGIQRPLQLVFTSTTGTTRTPIPLPGGGVGDWTSGPLASMSLTQATCTPADQPNARQCELSFYVNIQDDRQDLEVTYDRGTSGRQSQSMMSDGWYNTTGRVTMGQQVVLVLCQAGSCPPPSESPYRWWIIVRCADAAAC